MKTRVVEEISCFKAYDLRGRIPDEINEDIAYRVGRAYATWLQPARVVVGHDIRLSSPGMCQALIGGLLEGGVDVFHIGQCGTEEIYFATSHFEMDGGIVITASHNPKNYNGMKLVREESKPISSDSGLNEIKALAEANVFEPVAKPGQLVALDHHAAYCAKLLSYVDIAKLKPLKVVVNAGNGGAGAVIDRIEKFLPLQFIKVHHQADGNFPNGVPNPLLPENRVSTINAITEHQADSGIAWDGDFVRCFCFDDDGRVIVGYAFCVLLL